MATAFGVTLVQFLLAYPHMTALGTILLALAIAAFFRNRYVIIFAFGIYLIRAYTWFQLHISTAYYAWKYKCSRRQVPYIPRIMGEDTEHEIVLGANLEKKMTFTSVNYMVGYDHFTYLYRPTPGVDFVKELTPSDIDIESGTIARAHRSVICAILEVTFMNDGTVEIDVTADMQHILGPFCDFHTGYEHAAKDATLFYLLRPETMRRCRRLVFNEQQITSEFEMDFSVNKKVRLVMNWIGPESQICRLDLVTALGGEFDTFVLEEMLAKEYGPVHYN